MNRSTLDYIKDRVRDQFNISLDLGLFELIDKCEDELLGSEGKTNVPKLTSVVALQT